MNSDSLTLASVLIFLTVLAIAAWLGGGRKWAFRALLSVLVLCVVGVVGVVLYYIWDEHSARVRNRRLHECAVARVAAPKCAPLREGDNIPNDHDLCPLYALPRNPTPQQEEDAIVTALKECEEEEGKGISLHDEISRYREQHGIKPPVDPYASIAKPIKTTLSVTVCADKIRKKYPGAYTDLSDANLIKKVLAKYPSYCDYPNDQPGWEPVIEDVR